MLSNMGVIIHGAGTEEIAVTGKVHHKEIRYDVMSDRIVAGTYICAAAQPEVIYAVLSIEMIP